MACQTWLELRSGAPGLAGPFLIESTGPYRYLHRSQKRSPGIIVAIGGAQKRRFLYENFSVQPGDGSNSVRLTALPFTTDALLDCEIHSAHQLPRVKADPAPWHYVAHELRHRTPDISQIAFSLYCSVLLPFAASVLLHVPDVGGLPGVIDFLVLWTTMSMRQAPTTLVTVILIFSNQKRLPEPKEIYLYTSANLLKKLSVSEPTTPYTRSRTDTAVRQCFEIQCLPLGMERLSIRNFVSDAFRTAALRRRQGGLDFPAPHLERFMKAAISHYASHRFVPFNIYNAASTTHPVNPQMHQYLGLYLQGSKLTSLEAAGLTASALLVDAYRAEVHRFRPDIIFSERYRDVVAKLEETIALSHFAELVRERFVDFAAVGFPSPVTTHIALLRASCSTSTLSLKACSICLVRHFKYSLECGHRLCQLCVVTWGRNVGTWNFKVQTCPICRRDNTNVLTLKPPTAGERLLYIGGTSPEDIWSFLNCLRKELNVSSLGLKDYFDGVVASETGIYFALTIFLESWSLSDCKYHVRYLKSVKVSKAGLATFGKGLAWDLKTAEDSSSVDFVFQTRRGTFSNFVAQIETLDDFTQICSNSLNTDILVHADRYTLDATSLQPLSVELICYLFYIELSAKSSTFPQEYSVRVLCRIPPGSGLMDLLMKCRLRSACFLYRGGETQFTETELCPTDLWDRCRKGQPFQRNLVFEAMSLDSNIDVQIDGFSSGPHSISRCPYRLNSLVHDQLLHYLPEAEKGSDAANKDTTAITDMLRVLDALKR